MGAPFRLTERQRTDYRYQGDWVLLFLEGRQDYSTPLKDHAIWIKNQGKERERCSEVSLQHSLLQTVNKLVCGPSLFADRQENRLPKDTQNKDPTHCLTSTQGLIIFSCLYTRGHHYNMMPVVFRVACKSVEVLVANIFIARTCG